MITARYLVFALVLALGLSVLASIFFADWEAVWEARVDGDTQSYLMDLPNQPLWITPSAPSYADFNQHFSQAPVPREGRTFVRIKWDWMLDGLFTNWLLIFICYGLVHLFSFKQSSSLVAAFFLRVGLGLIGSAAVCILTWVLFGGWGPPSPRLFGIYGVLAGVYMGYVHLRRQQHAEPSAESNKASSRNSF